MDGWERSCSLVRNSAVAEDFFVLNRVGTNKQSHSKFQDKKKKRKLGSYQKFLLNRIKTFDSNFSLLKILCNKHICTKELKAVILK